MRAADSPKAQTELKSGKKYYLPQMQLEIGVNEEEKQDGLLCSDLTPLDISLGRGKRAAWRKKGQEARVTFLPLQTVSLAAKPSWDNPVWARCQHSAIYIFIHQDPELSISSASQVLSFVFWSFRETLPESTDTDILLDHALFPAPLTVWLPWPALTLINHRLPIHCSLIHPWTVWDL